MFNTSPVIIVYDASLRLAEDRWKRKEQAFPGLVSK